MADPLQSCRRPDLNMDKVPQGGLAISTASLPWSAAWKPLSFIPGTSGC
ncbi:hypothetical protein PY32053_02598 [Paracoccus yeei]|uniref:Uncharacterized protein n=1 Tax=Paracoccus yeei TaxID=147645 RepID=A0A386UNN7_9RHOB|nr:hypothetical protein PY32053_02598 [Paracoccus yeei]